MGGPCEAELSAETMDEMIAVGMEHLEAEHPEMAEKLKTNTQAENDAWAEEFREKWEEVPESEE